MEPTLNVAALHDLASYGRCSLTCVIPILSSMGVKVCPIPTAVYSSDTGGFGAVFSQELTGVMRHIMEKLRAIPARIDGIYSGYLGTPEQLSVVSDFFDEYDCLKVVDPVMGDQGVLYSAFDTRMKTVRLVKKHAPSLKIGLLCDNVSDPEIAYRVKQAREAGEIDVFFYESVETDYLADVVDSL